MTCRHGTLSEKLLLRVGVLLASCLFSIAARAEEAHYPDYLVIEAVLKDLLANPALKLSDPEFNPTAQKRERTSQIILSEKTPRSFAASDRFMLTLQERRHLPENVWNHCVARNEAYPPVGAYQTNPLYARSFWRKYTPSDRHILVKDMDWIAEEQEGWERFKELYPDAKGFIMPWLPGYSPDKKIAVVHFRYGPILPSCFPAAGWGTYLLVNSNGKWAVKRKWLIK